MLLTLSGIVILVNELQYANVPSSIPVKFEGRVIL